MPPGVTKVRVRYAETDQMGRAHHMAYVAWFELGRTELMRRSGLSYAEMERRGVFLPVVRLQVDYLGAAGYEELLAVHTRLAEVRSRRVRFDYAVLGGEGRRIAEASTVLVCVGSDGRPRRLPEDLREALSKLVDGRADASAATE